MGKHRVAEPCVKSRGLSPLPVARFAASAEPAASSPMAGRGCLRISNQLTSGPHIRTSINIKYARIDADRFAAVAERKFELAVTMQDEAAIDAGGGKGWIELDSLIEIGNSSIMATLFIPN